MLTMGYFANKIQKLQQLWWMLVVYWQLTIWQ